MKAGLHGIRAHCVPRHYAFNKCIEKKFIINRVPEINIVRVPAGEIGNKACFILLAISELGRNLVTDHKRFIEDGLGCIDLGLCSERIEVPTESKIVSDRTE